MFLQRAHLAMKEADLVVYDEGNASSCAHTRFLRVTLFPEERI
jgi:hypothetical protein